MFAEKLRALRSRKGLTLRELEKISGVSNVLISNYENGKVVSTPKMMRKLAAGLDVTFEELQSAIHDVPVQPVETDELRQLIEQAERLTGEERRIIAAVLKAFIRQADLRSLMKS